MLQIAKILRSNGTDGGVLVGLYDIAPEEIDLKEPVYIEFDGLPVPFFILDITPKGTSKAVIHLNDVVNLTDAEELTGRTIMTDLELEDEAFEDFTGWTVLDNGKEVGVCTGLEPIPGNPCLTIGEILIPLHEDFIIGVDSERRELNLDLPQGLY